MVAWSESTGDAMSEMSPSSRLAQAILAQLPQRYCDILTYRFMFNYSIQETAPRMGLSEGNVRVLQCRALRKASEIVGHV